MRRVAYYVSEAGGSLSLEDARKAAFQPCNDPEEAKKHFQVQLADLESNIHENPTSA